jgi:3-isopropylmalate dehydrogenase
MEDAANAIDAAVKGVIDDGLRTGDIFSGSPGTKLVNTAAMGDAIVARLEP